MWGSRHANCRFCEDRFVGNAPENPSCLVLLDGKTQTSRSCLINGRSGFRAINTHILNYKVQFIG